jgi:hypothetical protein
MTAKLTTWSKIYVSVSERNMSHVSYDTRDMRHDMTAKLTTWSKIYGQRFWNVRELVNYENDLISALALNYIIAKSLQI